MRRPKQRKDKSSDADRQPPGGRAWQRVEQFTRSRGLPSDDAPTATDKTDVEKKPAPRKPRKDG